MPIVLSGDVHHWIPSADRRHASQSESTLAVEYASIAARHGVKVTLFFTGRAVRDDADDARPLLSMNSVEIGGHGWDAFQPGWFYRPLAKLSGSPHGYRMWQRRSIQRTCAVIEALARRPVHSWRNHAYVHDDRTPELLGEAGISVWSDDVTSRRASPYPHESGLTVLPLNTTPDHENLYHGDRTPDALGGTPSMNPADWLARVSDEVASITSAGGVATVLAHPMCMKVADGWETFEQLCQELSKYETLFAHEVRLD